MSTSTSSIGRRRIAAVTLIPGRLSCVSRKKAAPARSASPTLAKEHLDHIIGETGVTPALNQIELHPTFQQKALREVHDKLGIETQSWSPLGQGKLLGNAVIGKVAAKHGRTPAQVVIRWHMDNGLIVIPKSVTPSRIEENFNVFDFKLDADDLAEIAKLDPTSGRIGPDPVKATF